MIQLIASLLFLSALQAGPVCSSFKTCRAEKTSLRKGNWKSEYVKEFPLEKFCQHDRPAFGLEKDLGIELWLFSGSDSESGFKRSPYVQVNLHTSKLTHVIAQAAVPVGGTGVELVHRLGPKTFVSVLCH